MELDATPDESLRQSFTVERPAKQALDDAAAYLKGFGTVAPKMRGRLERFGDSLAVHHGRIETRIRVEASGSGSRVEVSRHGQAPLEDTRKWLLVLGLAGFLIAWGLTFYNERLSGGLHPMMAVGLFLIGLVATVAVLFVADRSLERHSEGVVLALEDAMRGDPMEVLRFEVNQLNRSASAANAFLFYCASLVVTFFAYAIVFSEGVRAAIDETAALTTMQYVFLFPIVPSLIFGLAYYYAQGRGYSQRLNAMAGRK